MPELPNRGEGALLSIHKKKSSIYILEFHQIDLARVTKIIAHPKMKQYRSIGVHKLQFKSCFHASTHRGCFFKMWNDISEHLLNRFSFTDTLFYKHN